MGISVFSKLKLPKKTGNNDHVESKNTGFIYSLTLVSLEGEPTYTLESSLSFGKSEEASDVVIEDEVISPKHCTFILNQDVILLIDHASISGTFIGKNKLTPGKSYIVTEEDKIFLGDLEVKISITPNLTEIPEEDIPARALTEDDTQDIVVEVKEKEILKPLEEDEPKPKKEKIKKEKPQKEKKIKVKHSSSSSANAFVRFLALGIDLCLFYAGVTIISELLLLNIFQETVDFNTYYEPLWKMILEFYPSIEQDLLSFSIENAKNFVGTSLSLYVLFFAYRIVSALLFKVTLGQFLIGLGVGGHPLFKRIIGGVREILFMLLSPLFIITHLGTLVSKRSLEELITFTKIEVGSSFRTILLTLLFIPLSLFIVIVSPLFTQMELPKDIVVSEIPQTKTEGDLVQSISYSRTMNLGSLHAETYYPAGAIKKSSGKKYFYPEVTFKSNDNIFYIRLQKHFTLPVVFKNFFSSMYFNQENYPNLRNYADYSHSVSDNLIRKEVSPKALKTELSFFLNEYLNPNFESIINIFLENGPIFHAIVDFRQTLQDLTQGEIFNIKLGAFGDIPVFFLDSTNKSKLYFFPIGFVNTPLFEIEVAHNKNIDQVFSPLYKKKLRDFIFSREKQDGHSGAFEMVDYLSSYALGKNKYEKEIYTFFYKRGQKEFLLKNDGDSFALSLKKVNQIVESSLETQEKSSLYQELSELLEAFNSKDKNFFKEKKTTVR